LFGDVSRPDPPAGRPEESTVFRGPATLNVYADDVVAASTWYADLFGIQPYFVRPVDGPPAYVEFRVGDRQFEFGVIDRRWSPYAADATQPAGAVLHWAVDDLDTAIADVLARGATELEPRTERGPGFVTASFTDPFGNVLGLMHNVHYLEMAQRVRGATT